MTKPARRASGSKTKKTGGRPAFAATEAHRRKVKALRKSGLTEAEIAGALGITEPTLRKHFAAELQYVPTAADRRKVSIAAGYGMSQREIALAMGLTVVKLKKHFAHELTAGALERRVEVLQAMQAAAKKGNVSAQRAYLSTTPAMGEPPPTRPKGAAPGVPKRGKKEQAQDDANNATAGSEWDDLLPPHGAVLQ